MSTRNHEVCNQRILTDEHTPPELLLSTFFAELVRSGHICLKDGCRCDIATIPRAGWRLTPQSLVSIREDDNPVTAALVTFIAALPRMNTIQQYDDYMVDGRHNPTTRQIEEQADNAALVAKSLVEKDTYVLNLHGGKLVCGNLDVPLVLVHEDVTEEPGFLAIMIAVLEEQLRHGFVPQVKVYTHQGTKGTIRHFPLIY